MNYLYEILAFNNFIRYNSEINKSDICLWYTLMYMANRFYWKEFNIPILTLSSESRLSRNDLYKSRAKLKKLGLIDFKEQNGNKATVYKMNSIASIYGTQIDMQNIENITQSILQTNTQNMIQSVNIHKTRNNKHKTINKKEIYKEKNPKAKQKKKSFSPDSEAYLLAKHFEKCIQMHSPSFPSKEAQRQRWAKDIDLMLRIDKLDPDDIAQTIQWCQQDSFWKSNILSGKKLREKYQQLRIKMEV